MTALRAAIVARPATHQQVWATALAEGLERHGVTVARIASPDEVRGCDFAACWGWRVGERLRAQRLPVLVLERGYIGDRHAWTSLAWNGLNGRGDFCLPATVGTERAERHFGALLRPWRQSGGSVVAVMGQVEGDAALGGRSLMSWYRTAARDATLAYGLPAVFRPHPVAVQRGQPLPSGVTIESGTLQSLLARARAVVTWNSNSGVEAVLAGVPTVALDAGAMCLPVAGRRIGDLARPDRLAWFARLAWCQWRLEELADGSAWERMRQGCRADEGVR